MPNISTEDYIKHIYKLEQEGKKVTTSALAASLDLSDPSVTDMIKKLSEKGHVSYEPYRGVGLTKQGRQMALKIVRRHRLWEMYLMQFLGFSWDQVHDEAERLEHVTSDDMERRLDEALGFPKADPHGDPIPTVDGKLHETEYAPLASCVAGEIVKILRVSDEDPAILQHATKIGVKLNAKVTIREKTEFDGTMMVKVGSKQQFISQRVAEAIFVERV